MRIIISPAKKMNVDTDSLAPRDLPLFLNRTERLLEKLRGMSDEELKKRNLELERENAELRKANDILKDALGFFAKDRKK